MATAELQTRTHPAHRSQQAIDAPVVSTQADVSTGYTSVTRFFAWPALFVLLGIAAMSVDVPLARWFKADNFPSSLKKLCLLAEVFGHGTGAVMIFITAWVLAPQYRHGLPRAISGTFIAGMSANVLKMMVSRRRPYKFNLDYSVFKTFRGWFPMLSAGTAGQGFPSGHTATAVALALGLTWLFPRGKWLFATLAALAALQRLVTNYHFLSDTLWGAAVGWICASACLPGGWLSPKFDRFESRLTGAGS